MAKNEVYIYDALYSYTSKDIVESINAFGEEDFTVRMDCPGGNVTSGWAIISKLSELKQKKICIVDGQASSMAAMMLLFFDEVIVNDTSEVMYHKAAYPSWCELSAEDEEKLITINTLMREKLEATSVPTDVIEKIFKADVRHDVDISPDDLVTYKIATEKRTLDVATRQALRNNAVAINYKRTNKAQAKAEPNINIKVKKMTLEEFKAENPAGYAEACKQGAAEEKMRTEAFLVSVDVKDNPLAARAVKAIKDGESFSGLVMAEMMQLSVAQMQKTNALAEAEPDLGEDPEDTTPAGDAGKLTPEAKKEAKAESDYKSVMANVKSKKTE